METCRICYETDSLISACQCNGTMKFVHEICIRKWIEVSGRNTCELCRQPYTIEIPEETYNMTNAPVVWTIVGVVWAYLQAIMVIDNTNQNSTGIYGLIFITVIFNTVHYMLWGFIKRFNPLFSLVSLSVWILIFISMSLYLQLSAGLVSQAILVYCITIGSFTLMFFNTIYS